MLRLALIFIIAAGCSSYRYKKGVLAKSYIGGIPVVCLEITRRACGVSLKHCSTGLDYDCVTDVMLLDTEKIVRTPETVTE